MNESYWLLSSKSKKYKVLDEDISTDYLIVGGGIVGLTTAFLLAKEKLSVTLLDADRIGYGATGRNTGKVTTMHNSYAKIEKKYGLEKAKLYYEANNKALKFIKNTIYEYNIDCDFEKVPAFIYTTDENYIEDLKSEYEACLRIGIPCKYYDELEGVPLDVKGAISFENQGQFNPKKYINALAELCEKLGVKIYENTPVDDLKKETDYIIKTRNNNTINSKNLVIASHTPWYDGGLKLYFGKEEANCSYLLATDLNIDLPNGMYLSIEEPVRTFKIYNESDKKVLIIGGSDHQVGKGNIESDIYEEIEKFAESSFNSKKTITKWMTQDYISFDDIPYIGHINSKEKNIYVATGFCKWGNTNGTVAGLLIRDLILNNSSEYEELFNPTRGGSYLSTRFMSFNLGVALDYVNGKLNFGYDDMPRRKGEGRIVNIDGKRYGAFRNYDGNLHIVDITCTHLGCELRFNSAENTWDCPCHGSRFDYDGNILNGPALKPLKKYGNGKNEVDPKLL